MDLKTIEQQIRRLLCLRRGTVDEETLKRINAQLEKLYEFKWELLRRHT